MQHITPEGFWIDTHGRHVPPSLVKPIDKTRDDLVRDLIASAKRLEKLLTDFKTQAFADIDAFVSLSAEQHKVHLGGRKGNITLVTFDGRYKILRAIQDSLAFDEQIQAAKQMIDNCAARFSEGGSDEARAIINDAFQVDSAGKISTGRVLGLRRLNIKDEEWLRAMQAISDSIRRDTSSTYVRFYERVGDTDKYEAVSLDLARL